MSQVRNQKYEKYGPTSDLKTCGHILFEMLSPNFCLDYIYLIYFIYIYSKVDILKLSYKINHLVVDTRERALLVIGHIFRYE